jgi:class 3 adenylate cyclase
VAFFFQKSVSTDVVGYSRLMGDNEEATIRTLTAYRALISALIQQYRGRVVDAPGDNVLAEFASVVDAVRCAVGIQQALKEKNTELPPQRQMHFRIGINLGDVVVEGERLYGDGVNIAARLESLAEPGGICISGKVFEEVESKLPLTFEYQGEQTVKNIMKPVRVYRAVLEESLSPHAASLPSPAQRSRFKVQRMWRRVRPAHQLIIVAGLVLIAGVMITVRYGLFSSFGIPHSALRRRSRRCCPYPTSPLLQFCLSLI